MAEPTAEEKAKADEAAKKVQETAKAQEAAKKAADEKRQSEKDKADNPHLHDPDYTGTLTGTQALARLEKFGPHGSKPASAGDTKGGK